MAAALVEPRLYAVGQGAISPSGENSNLAVAAKLGIHFAHGRLVRGKLLLDPGTHVARCAGQIVLGVLQLIHIKIQLRLGDFQVVVAAGIGGCAGARASNYALAPGRL